MKQKMHDSTCKRISSVAWTVVGRVPQRRRVHVRGIVYDGPARVHTSYKLCVGAGAGVGGIVISTHRMNGVVIVSALGDRRGLVHG